MEPGEKDDENRTDYSPVKLWDFTQAISPASFSGKRDQTGPCPPGIFGLFSKKLGKPLCKPAQL